MRTASATAAGRQRRLPIVPGRRGGPLRRLALVVVAAALTVGGWLVWTTLRPQPPAWRLHLAAIAKSQVGYRTDPPDTYCNQYSAYWGSGTADCGNHNLDEEWCADFAAWVWAEGAVPFSYGTGAGEISSASFSFYQWGVAHNAWHGVGSDYTPKPGDVAVYGLDVAASTATHVAVVLKDGSDGPDVVNGDGDRTGFSVVEIGDDERNADTAGSNSPLAGYASPLAPPPHAAVGS